MFKISWLIWIETLTIFDLTALPTGDICTYQENILKCTGNFQEDFEDVVTVLELRKLNSNILDFDKIFTKFPVLQNLTITESNIARIHFGENRKKEHDLKELRLTRLFIHNISSDFLSHFPSLELISLEENYLASFPENFSINNVKEMYLRGNRWNCSENLDWVIKLNKTIVKDFDKLVCFGNPYPGKPLIAAAQFLKELRETCTPRCECSMEKITIADISSSQAELMPIFMMNCSKRGFTELPTDIPNNTRILHLEGNSISTVEPLRTNGQYRGVWDLYLDDNQISNLRVLEGSYWLTHFRTFSLKRNKLAKLPCYALDNAFVKNPNMPITRLYLGGNPWRCDCVFTPVFQELVLRKYAAQVVDSLDVKCSNIEGDPKLPKSPIIELTRSSVCRLPAEYSLQDGLDLLNAVLASLIVFILGKLAYDYYHFKKTGRLPWIIMKMP